MPADLTSSGATLVERLEHLRALAEAAHRKVDPEWQMDLRPPANLTLLETIERESGRYFSAEALELYRWHDGCGGKTEFVPLIDFNSLQLGRDLAEGIAEFGPFSVTNVRENIELADLFPSFNSEKILLSTKMDKLARPAESPLYVLNLEGGQVTREANTLRDFIDHLIELYEAGRLEVIEGGLRWTDLPFSLALDMEPYGLAGNESGEW